MSAIYLEAIAGRTKADKSTTRHARGNVAKHQVRPESVRLLSISRIRISYDDRIYLRCPKSQVCHL